MPGLGAGSLAHITWTTSEKNRQANQPATTYSKKKTPLVESSVGSISGLVALERLNGVRSESSDTAKVNQVKSTTMQTVVRESAWSATPSANSSRPRTLNQSD
eukprot:3847130-Rhodomonas_salina.1